MDVQALAAKLHPLERAVLLFLKEEKELSALVKKAKLADVEVMRALQWLENKGAVTLASEKKKIIVLGKNGQCYQKEGLPEKAFLSVLTEEFKRLNVLTKKSKLSREEVNACIGLLKKKGAVDLQKGELLQLKITAAGKKLLTEHSPEEKFLAKSFPLDVQALSAEELKVAEELKRRKEFVSVEEQKMTHITLTPLGQQLAALDLSSEVINRLTPKMLSTGSWKDQQFRSYDVEINVPRRYPGKKHFENEAIEYIKSIWLEMGFREMTGNYVQSAFWDLDALFVPQDHPAREMQDTFYLEGKAKLPELWTKVKEVHENGRDTGSTGWRYAFSKEETEQLLLRTHTTVLSAQTLAKLKKQDLPAKFFAVGKVFRNEALDWKHLFEFYQVEGIVVDPHATLKHLKGYLQQFYHKMGYTAVRMRPAHF
ncbi:phenylalanine--tRNA ligase subunit alpha, partial [Candidatus Woesearchaeota archaeon]|nr:phenylalanine--tRNA ligase subunit alpha [Candidatus Woesearchaeota archaeon]